VATRRIRRSDITFEFDDRDFDAIRRSGEVKAALRDMAQEAASRAKATAPEETGEYADSIHVEVDETRTRARARVVADVEHATVVESRTGNLRRALGG
jgi:hypothetical protein